MRETPWLHGVAAQFDFQSAIRSATLRFEPRQFFQASVAEERRGRIIEVFCTDHPAAFMIRGELRPVIYCHCSQCLKTHGHFAAYTSAAKEQIEWQSQETLCWFDSSEKARRGFCGKCGASLFYELKGGAGLSITAGSIESPTGLHAAGHIYFENHSDYYEVLDQLPKFRENSSEDFPD